VTVPAKPVTARINEHVFLGGRHIGGLRLPLSNVTLAGGNP
jgi:hypothetical protein